MEDDSERNEIRSELSKMSFVELQALKQQLGSKVYKEAMFGVKGESVKKKEFTRETKNRPREVSSKIKPSFGLSSKNKNKNKNKSKNQPQVRDPRFDRLCGDYNEKRFKEDYSFITDIRQSEKLKLKKQLKNVKNPERKSELQYLVQRMENQDREETRRLDHIKKKEKEREEHVKSLIEGHKPHFKTKFEKKVVDLVEKYDKLKKSGKLQKHMEKERKKQNSKDRKKGYFENSTQDQ